MEDLAEAEGPLPPFPPLRLGLPLLPKGTILPSVRSSPPFRLPFSLPLPQAARVVDHVGDTPAITDRVAERETEKEREAHGQVAMTWEDALQAREARLGPTHRDGTVASAGGGGMGVPRAVNAQANHKSSRSLHRGVRLEACDGKWQSRIKTKGKELYLGAFGTEELAGACDGAKRPLDRSPAPEEGTDACPRREPG